MKNSDIIAIGNRDILRLGNIIHYIKNPKLKIPTWEIDRLKHVLVGNMDYMKLNYDPITGERIDWTIIEYYSNQLFERYDSQKNLFWKKLKRYFIK